MRYDRLQSILTLPNYIEIEPAVITVDCPATVVPNSSIRTFSSSGTVVADAFFFRRRAIGSVTGRGVNIISSRDIGLVWSYTTSEIVSTLTLMSGNTMSIDINVTNNTGSSLTTVAQTIEFIIHRYRLA